MPRIAGIDKSGSKPGTIIPFAGGALPVGTLACNGALVLIADFPLLYAAIGTDYNTGGETPGVNFRLPNTQGRSLVGEGTGDYAGTVTPRTRAQKLGRESVALAIADMPSHNHGGGTHSHNLRYASDVLTGGGAGGYSHINPAYGFSGAGTVVSNETATVVASQGSGALHENMSPSLVVKAVIAYI